MTPPLPEFAKITEEAQNAFRKRPPKDASVLSAFATWIAWHKKARGGADDADLDRGLSAGLARALPSCASHASKLKTFEDQTAMLGAGTWSGNTDAEKSFLNVVTGWYTYRNAIE